MSIQATFWSFASMQQYVAAIPYTANGSATGPYVWSNTGAGAEFARPTGSPGCRVGATVGQFLFLGDLYWTQQQTLFFGDGSTVIYSGQLNTPIIDGAQILDQQGLITGTASDGTITGSGYLTNGTLNYSTGALSVNFNTAPTVGDQVYAQYTQVAPYRAWWSAIGSPTNWPTPLTQAAIAVQSGYNDLQADLGQIMFIAGYPLYGLIFQMRGITRASYIGGQVVWSWQPYEFKRGCIAHGAAVKVGPLVYFLADDGFFATDGANVVPIGTAQDNSSGIDNWFWANVNTSALEAIRAAYDATKRAVFFAIPTGSNTLPDTLLIYNVIAQTWTRAQVLSETIWTADNGQDGKPGTKELVGVFDQTHTPNFLVGSPPLTGYMESADMYFMDGTRRLLTGVRPLASTTDRPLVTVGSRKSLSDSVRYSKGALTHQFSRIAPALGGNVYTRVRVQSGGASSLQGATLLLEKDGTV